MCKINSSEHNILSYKCNDLKFCEHEFNSAQSANFVSTNLKTPVPCHAHAHIVRMRSLVDHVRMVFPSRAVFVSSVAGSILLLVGFPKWAALTISFLGFLGMGGLQYCRLVYRTLPRDLK